MYYLLILVLAFNILVTLKLLRKEEFDKKQKIRQAIIIWILPLLGAAIIYAFLRSEDEPRGPDEPPFGGGSNATA